MRCPSCLLVLLALALLPACKVSEEPGYESSCPQVEEVGVAESYQAWTDALAENDHYRFRVGARFVDVEGSDPMNPSYCVYDTTVEVIGYTVVSRELSLREGVGPLADSCEEGWVEEEGAVGSHMDERALEPTIVDDIYELCCAEVFLAPDNGGFDFFYTQASGFMATCGDDYCDDGGCVEGSGPELSLGPIEFID